jgi:hypothetical protein
MPEGGWTHAQQNRWHGDCGGNPKSGSETGSRLGGQTGGQGNCAQVPNGIEEGIFFSQGKAMNEAVRKKAKEHGAGEYK